MFFVFRICIVVLIGKAVIVIEVVGKKKGLHVRQSGIELPDLCLIEKETDLFIQKDRFQIRFLQAGEGNVEIPGQSGMQDAVSFLIEPPAVFGESGQQRENAFFETGILNAVLQFAFCYVVFLFHQ